MVKLAPPIATTPRSAARRVAPWRLASTAATANHSRLWFAAVVSPLKIASAGQRGMIARRLTNPRSIRSIFATTLRNQSCTLTA